MKKQNINPPYIVTSILIIEDDFSLRSLLTKFLEKNGYEVLSAEKGKEGLEMLTHHTIHCILLDLRLPDCNGIDILQKVKKLYPDMTVIMMTFYDDVRSAVSAIKSGARDYLTKPVNPEELLGLIRSFTTPRQTDAPVTGHFIKGQSKSFEAVLNYASLVAPTNVSVLITGESGTGKEVLASYIHHHSLRKDKPFVTIDCGSVSDELFASKFFGHMKGAFTGAIQDKQGLLETANGGTLFLDELGNLSYENQVKLLRVLQEKKVKRVGSLKEVPIDIRLIAATNEDLIQSVQKEKFREDLYHRLNEFRIEIPSLKERREDLKELIRYFISDSNKEFGKKIAGVQEDVFQTLSSYSFPGNIRELKNIIRRAVLLAKESEITRELLPEEVLVNRPFTSDTTNLKTIQGGQEKEAIIKALKQTGNNKSKAALLLNIDRKTLYNKLKLYQLE